MGRQKAFIYDKTKNVKFCKRKMGKEEVKLLKPSLLCCWPAHIDYPLFRLRLRLLREYFGDVIIAITQEAHGESRLADEVLNDLLIPKIVFHVQEQQGDWRNNAVREALQRARDPYVLFLEQDFLFKQTVLDEVLETKKDFVYYKEGDRVHPAFALVRRELLNRTSKDFSASPPEFDHFGLFFQELWRLSKDRKGGEYERISITRYSLLNGRDFYHLGGLTQNYHCFKHQQPFYQPETFLAYNYYVQQLPINQHPDFIKLAREIEDTHGQGDREGSIKHFFK